jgi:hypothetical protein
MYTCTRPAKNTLAAGWEHIHTMWRCTACPAATANALVPLPLPTHQGPKDVGARHNAHALVVITHHRHAVELALRRSGGAVGEETHTVSEQATCS